MADSTTGKTKRKTTAASKKPAGPVTYRVVVGCSFGPTDRHANPGDLVTAADLGADVVDLFLRDGVIEPAGKG